MLKQKVVNMYIWKYKLSSNYLIAMITGVILKIYYGKRKILASSEVYNSVLHE